MNPANRPNFLGLSEEETVYNEAKVAVLPVPYEATVSFGGGTEKGPQAIIEASAQVELFDEELAKETYKVGVATLEPLKLKNVRPGDLFKVITPAVSKILDDGKWPMILGGEHSITPPVVRAICDRYPDVTAVQLDAHADLRPEYEGDPMSHASAMARVREMCPAVQIGIRNISIEGRAAAEKNKYPIIYAHEMQSGDAWMRRAIDYIGTDNVYITLDVDAFDASILPATGTPEPGGMTWYQVTGFLQKLFRWKNVVGMDLAELAPIEGFNAYDFMMAKLAYKSIGYWAISKNLL